MEHEVRAEKTSWWNHFIKSEFFYHYKNNLPAIIGSILVLFAILTAVAGRFLAPQNPYDLTQISLMDSYLPPAWLDGGKLSFLLGTDEQGRDILSAIIYGSASSIMIGLVGMAASCCIGTTLGLIAGYFGGKVDAVIMRIADIQLSFPSMLIALFIMSVFGRGVGKLLIALTMVGWVTYARTVRGETLSVKKMEYVEAARTIGLPNRIIILKHVLPNVINSIIVLANHTDWQLYPDRGHLKLPGSRGSHYGTVPGSFGKDRIRCAVFRPVVGFRIPGPVYHAHCVRHKPAGGFPQG